MCVISKPSKLWESKLNSRLPRVSDWLIDRICFAVNRLNFFNFHIDTSSIFTSQCSEKVTSTTFSMFSGSLLTKLPVSKVLRTWFEIFGNTCLDPQILKILNVFIKYESICTFMIYHIMNVKIEEPYIRQTLGAL